MILRTLPVPAPADQVLAVCADFHSVYRNMRLDETLRLLEEAMPDLILCPGDIFNIIAPDDAPESCFNQNGMDFLRRAAALAPVFYSIGNHEHAVTTEHLSEIAKTGAVVLDNSFVRCGELVIGGYTTGFLGMKGKHTGPKEPDPDFPAVFGAQEGYKILLSHHPEYWEKTIRGHGIDLTVSGHAHGGQWRFFGHGVFAPGQGLFPKYTSGLYSYDAGSKTEFLAVSRGMRNTQRLIPRFFNPCEILILRLSPEARL
ncbi:MAG: metallophosphoesterase [Clostridia bacterium]|nr:metallophosphoesterase [Clostridia bacterium]